MDITAETTDHRPSPAVTLSVPLLFGAAAAAWIAQTALTAPGRDGVGSAVHLFLPLLFVVGASTLLRRAGLALRGPAVTACGFGMLFIAIALYSVGLGLVSLDLSWGVPIAALVGFAGVAGLAAVLVRTADAT